MIKIKSYSEEKPKEKQEEVDKKEPKPLNKLSFDVESERSPIFSKLLNYSYNISPLSDLIDLEDISDLSDDSPKPLCHFREPLNEKKIDVELFQEIKHTQPQELDLSKLNEKPKLYEKKRKVENEYLEYNNEFSYVNEKKRIEEAKQESDAEFKRQEIDFNIKFEKINSKSIDDENEKLDMGSRFNNKSGVFM